MGHGHSNAQAASQGGRQGTGQRVQGWGGHGRMEKDEHGSKSSFPGGPGPPLVTGQRRHTLYPKSDVAPVPTSAHQPYCPHPAVPTFMPGAVSSQTPSSPPEGQEGQS